MPKALGLVETRGLVAAIEAADAMVKTSNVTLVGKEVINPAFVTIKIVGEVAAVKAAVDAGAEAARKVGVLVSTHIIPQPDSQMVWMLPEISDDVTKKKKDMGVSSTHSEVKPTIAPPEKKIDKEPTPDILKDKPGSRTSKKSIKLEPEKEQIPEIKETASGENLFTETTDHLERLRREALGIKSGKEEIKENKSLVSSLSMKELEELNVHQLRKQARAIDEFPIHGREISKANRRELLDHFKKII
jgi:ethanolamine utilization protein EutM